MGYDSLSWCGICQKVVLPRLMTIGDDKTNVTNKWVGDKIKEKIELGGKMFQSSKALFWGNRYL